MNTVNILPPDVIAKIAAGEVVERPASVIKELVENSLDAGADTVEVHLKDAGKEIIYIKDDGCGISQENLEKIFQRHATSKIQGIHDLEKLSSMGFRGEALYSIAAVSDIVLRTKCAVPPASAKDGPASGGKAGIHVESGWEIHLQGGQRLDLKPAAASAGTEIKITQLFYNTPARRKFLKSSTAEIQQIIHVFLPYALLYPQKRFVLTHAGRTIFDLKPFSSVLPTKGSVSQAISRMAEALNLEDSNLLEASQPFAELNASVRMILSTIDVQRPRRDLQFIFVNGRPVDSKNLSYNVNDVYRVVLPPGIYPAFLLDIQMDPADVDVNIHPTKREVRLRQEARLVSFVRHMTEYTLMQQGNAKVINADVSTHDLSQTLSPPNAFIGGPNTNNPLNTSPQEKSSNPGFPTKAFGNDNTPERNFSTSHWQAPSQDLFQTNNTLQTKFARARFIGQFINKYLLFEVDQSLFMVDQHAAQERIMYEEFESQMNEGNLEVQPLLTPILLKLSPAEKIAWEESQDKLKELGIDTTAFDNDTVAIQSQPLLLKNIENAVRILLSGDDIARCDHLTVARRACKASIVTGDKLDMSQADYQRQQLLACKDPFTCPHGRPTVVEITANFLDKQFLRT